MDASNNGTATPAARRRRKPPKCGTARTRYLKRELKREKNALRRKRLKRALKRVPACASPPAPLPAPPPAPTPARRRPQPPARPAETPVARYTGTFGPREAERLLWRAGFGPKPGQAAELAAMGLDAAVASLVRPPGDGGVLIGPEPHVSGEPLAPGDAFGHDHLWWLDRMIRTNQPLIERMTLIWHDWFATSKANVDLQQKMLDQNQLFRRRALDSFESLLLDVTHDPAMLLWLDGTKNTKSNPNENYAREVMELFTLGADRGAYSETDVRELARSFTGFRSDWTPELGHHNFRTDPKRFDARDKAVFGHTGPWDWQDACRLCLYHPLHPSFFVSKLWSYFIPVPPSDEDRKALESVYLARDYAVPPVVEAILKHPALHRGPAMVKPPVVFLAGLLRAIGRGVDIGDWWWLGEQTGQRLFFPPDVSGWDDTRWLDTSTIRARWVLVARAIAPSSISGTAASNYDKTEAPQTAVARALAYWGHPPISAAAHGELERFADACVPATLTTSQQSTYRAWRQNALRQLIGSSPDLQTS